MSVAGKNERIMGQGVNYRALAGICEFHKGSFLEVVISNSEV